MLSFAGGLHGKELSAERSADAAAAGAVRGHVACALLPRHARQCAVQRALGGRLLHRLHSCLSRAALPFSAFPTLGKYPRVLVETLHALSSALIYLVPG